MSHWLGLAGFVVCLVVVAVYAPWRLAFRNLEDAATKVRAAGFFVSGDRADGVIENGFVVTPRPIPPMDVNLLLKAGKMGPVWKDKVWVTRIPHPTVPDDAVPHAWGDVIAFGDSQLLDQIESKLCYFRVNRTANEVDGN